MPVDEKTDRCGFAVFVRVHGAAVPGAPHDRALLANWLLLGIALLYYQVRHLTPHEAL
jgi:hypothetical protein